MFIKKKVLAKRTSNTISHLPQTLSKRRLKIFALFVLCLTTLTSLFITGVQASPTKWLYGWISIVDSSKNVFGGGVGYHSSIAVDSMGNPHISYAGENDDLKYAKLTGTGWVFDTVDSAEKVSYNSIALDSSDNPHISYYDFINRNLMYARWNGTGWSLVTVDSAEDVGFFSSIAVDSMGNPHISYYDSTNKNLKYAKWNEEEMVWSLDTVNPFRRFGDVGGSSSIALDSMDNPHISYYDSTNGDLKYANWTGTGWSLVTVDSAEDVGYQSSIALDSMDNPHISYRDDTNRGMKYAKWIRRTWSVQKVDYEHVDKYSSTSIALDSLGNPHISYQVSIKLNGSPYMKDDLMYARWNGTGWSLDTVDSGNVGQFTSIAVDSCDNAHISYFNGGLKYAYACSLAWKLP